MFDNRQFTPPADATADTRARLIAVLERLVAVLERLERLFDRFARAFLDAKFPYGRGTDHWADRGRRR